MTGATSTASTREPCTSANPKGTLHPCEVLHCIDGVLPLSSPCSSLCCLSALQVNTMLIALFDFTCQPHHYPLACSKHCYARCLGCALGCHFADDGFLLHANVVALAVTWVGYKQSLALRSHVQCLL